MSELVETRWPHTLKQRIAAWGQGPWNDEADELEFEAHGFTCRLVRNAHMGCWCGYVALPNTHWAYGKEYSIIDDQLRRMCEDAPWCEGVPLDNVHGGLTYTAKDLPHSTRPTDREGQWWVGFDACHNTDLIPRYTRLGYPTPYRPNRKPLPYRTQFDMMVECGHLAMLLTDLPPPTAPD